MGGPTEFHFIKVEAFIIDKIREFCICVGGVIAGGFLFL